MLPLVFLLVFLVLSEPGCDSHRNDDVCHDKDTQADCASPCWWWTGCGCYGDSCYDPNHNTSETCKGSDDEDACVWNPESPCVSSTTGCCETASCNDYAHRAENTCKADEDCFWDGVNSRCTYPNCGNFYTADTCTGAFVYDEPCVWDGDYNHCGRASCDDYEHRTAEKCTGASVDGRPCLWDPNTGRCGYPGCDDFHHNTPETCKGVPDRRPCSWDSEHGRCDEVRCGNYDDDQSACSSIGCTWCANISECGYTSSSCSVDCHEADGYEEDCKVDLARFGCVWADGKCNNSSAFTVVVPTLLITLLLVVFIL